jgi:hypothetical protein
VTRLGLDSSKQVRKPSHITLGNLSLIGIDEGLGKFGAELSEAACNFISIVILLW